jgi:hypothetical protein
VGWFGDSSGRKLIIGFPKTRSDAAKFTFENLIALSFDYCRYGLHIISGRPQFACLLQLPVIIHAHGDRVQLQQLHRLLPGSTHDCFQQEQGQFSRPDRSVGGMLRIWDGHKSTLSLQCNAKLPRALQSVPDFRHLNVKSTDWGDRHSGIDEFESQHYHSHTYRPKGNRNACERVILQPE